MTNSLGGRPGGPTRKRPYHEALGILPGGTVAVGRREEATGTSKGKGVATGVKVAVTKLGGVKVPMVRAAMVG